MAAIGNERRCRLLVHRQRGCVVDDRSFVRVVVLAGGLAGEEGLHTSRASKNLTVNARHVHEFSERELDAQPGKPVTSIRVGFIVAAG